MASELTGLIRTERLALIADLETFSEQEWGTPSLCPAWTTQHVAAHLASATSMGPWEMAGGLARAGFRLNTFIAESAVHFAERGPDAVIERLRTVAESGAKPTGMPDGAALCDAVVHGLDIRVPVGRQHDIAPEAFRGAAEFMATAGSRFPASVLLGPVGKRIAGVRLVVEDPAWSHGSGPVVRTDAATVLLLMAGRPFARKALSGEGAETVLARV